MYTFFLLVIFSLSNNPLVPSPCKAQTIPLYTLNCPHHSDLNCMSIVCGISGIVKVHSEYRSGREENGTGEELHMQPMNISTRFVMGLQEEDSTTAKFA